MRRIAFNLRKHYTWALVQDEKGKVLREQRIDHVRGALPWTESESADPGTRCESASTQSSSGVPVRRRPINPPPPGCTDGRQSILASQAASVRGRSASTPSRSSPRDALRLPRDDGSQPSAAAR